MIEVVRLRKQYDQCKERLINDRTRLSDLVSANLINETEARQIEDQLNEVETLLKETLEILDILE